MSILCYSGLNCIRPDQPVALSVSVSQTVEIKYLPNNQQQSNQIKSNFHQIGTLFDELVGKWSEATIKAKRFCIVHQVLTLMPKCRLQNERDQRPSDIFWPISMLLYVEHLSELSPFIGMDQPRGAFAHHVVNHRTGFVDDLCNWHHFEYRYRLSRFLFIPFRHFHSLLQHIFGLDLKSREYAVPTRYDQR